MSPEDASVIVNRHPSDDTPSGSNAPAPNKAFQTSATLTKPKATQSNLSRGIFTLAMGQGGATIFTLLLSPLLTRLYSPEAFGPVTLLTSFCGLLAVFGTLSYSKAIPLTRRTRARQSLVSLCFVLAATTTVVTAVLVAIFGEHVARIYNKPELASYLTLVPLMFLLMALGQIVTLSLLAQRKHKLIAARTVLDKVISVLSQIALGATVLPNSPLGLVIGTITGTIVGACWGLRNVIAHTYHGTRYIVQRAPLIAIGRRHRELPRVHLLSKFIATAGVNAPTVIMGIYFPLEVIGLYALANRVLKIPSSLFTNASKQIYFVEAAELINQGRTCAGITVELLRLLSALTAIPVMFLLLFGEQCFGLLFGSSWAEAGVYAQILAPWIMVTVVGTPFTSLLTAEERFGESLAYTASLFVLRIGSVAIGGILLGPRGTLMLYTLANSILWIIMLIRVFRLTGVPVTSAVAIVGYRYLGAFSYLLPATAASWAGTTDWVVLILAVGGIAVGGAVTAHEFRCPRNVAEVEI